METLAAALYVRIDDMLRDWPDLDRSARRPALHPRSVMRSC